MKNVLLVSILSGLFFMLSCNNSNKPVVSSNDSISKNVSDTKIKNEEVQINEIGIFYKLNNELIALSKGSAKGLENRAIKISDNKKPELIVNLPDVKISEVRFGTNLLGKQNNDRKYTPVEAKIVTMEGKSGVYIVSPKNDLSVGTNVLIFGNPLGTDKVYTDIENAYPFIIK